MNFHGFCEISILYSVNCLLFVSFNSRVGNIIIHLIWKNQLIHFQKFSIRKAHLTSTCYTTKNPIDPILLLCTMPSPWLCFPIPSVLCINSIDYTKLTNELIINSHFHDQFVYIVLVIWSVHVYWICCEQKQPSIERKKFVRKDNENKNVRYRLISTSIPWIMMAYSFRDTTLMIEEKIFL